MQAITLEQLKQIKQTEIIELPPFNDGTPFPVEVKRPSMMNLVTTGKIPNTLLSSAMKIFKGGVGEAAQEAMEDSKALKELAGLMQVIAEASLVMPSAKDLKDANIELTEAQLVDLMNYMQGGVRALSTFRNE